MHVASRSFHRVRVQRNHFSRKQCMLHRAAFKGAEWLARPSMIDLCWWSACFTGHVSKLCSGRSTCSRCTSFFVCASTTFQIITHVIYTYIFLQCIMLKYTCIAKSSFVWPGFQNCVHPVWSFHSWVLRFHPMCLSLNTRPAHVHFCKLAPCVSAKDF